MYVIDRMTVACFDRNNDDEQFWAARDNNFQGVDGFSLFMRVTLNGMLLNGAEEW